MLGKSYRGVQLSQLHSGTQRMARSPRDKSGRVITPSQVPVRILCIHLHNRVENSSRTSSDSVKSARVMSLDTAMRWLVNAVFLSSLTLPVRIVRPTYT